MTFIFVIHELPSLGLNVGGTLIPAANTANAVLIVTDVDTDEVVFQGDLEANASTDVGQTNRLVVDTVTTGSVDDITDTETFRIYVGPLNPRLEFTDPAGAGEGNNIPDYDPAVLTSGGYAPGSTVYTPLSATDVSPTYRGFIWGVPMNRLANSDEDNPGTFVPRTDNVITAPGIGPDWTTRTPIQLANEVPFVTDPPFVTISDIIGDTVAGDTDSTRRAESTDGFPGTVVESEAGINYVYRPTDATRNERLVLL